MKKKVLSVLLATTMVATMLPDVELSQVQRVLFTILNFKPEADKAWQELAKAYKREKPVSKLRLLLL